MKGRQPKFWSLIKAEDGNSAELRIDGDIAADEDAWFYAWFGDPCTTPGSVREQLKALGNVPLTVCIDSPGGNVDAGAAIYTALLEYPGQTTAKIEARAYSAASVIAMACETVKISPMATMMVHLPWTEVAGNEHELRHVADVLAECRESLINAYQLKTGKSRAELLDLLEANDKQGTWMSAQRAIELGFADEMLYEWDSEPAQKAIVARAQAIYAMEHPEARKPSGGWERDAAAELEQELLRI